MFFQITDKDGRILLTRSPHEDGLRKFLKLCEVGVIEIKVIDSIPEEDLDIFLSDDLKLC